MRKYACLLALLLAPTLLAQTADLRILSFNVDKTTLTTGERFNVTMRWRNEGPDGVGNVVAEVGNGSGGFVLTGAGTSNWPCEPALAATHFTCRGVIPAGGEAEMVVTMRAPAQRQAATMTIAGSVGAANVSDPAPTNNSRVIEVPLAQASRRVDLSVSPTQQEHQASQRAKVTIPLNITNAGPDDAQDLVAHIAFAPGLQIPVTATGSNWSCANATHSPWLVLCSRSSLASGSSAPLTVEATMPRADGTYHFTARVISANAFDANGNDDWGSATVYIGEAADWEAILVPLLPAEVPGQNGARWKTHTTMLIAADVAPEIYPVFCDYGFPPHCAGSPFWPLRKPFDAGEEGLLGYGATRGGQFYYVRNDDSAKIWLNSRVWDVTREAQTAGAEIPIVRQRELIPGTNSILGIPVAPHYRHTLRVYDFEATSGGRVGIRVYANDETTPRADVIRTLTVSSNLRTTTAQLPIFPGYIELDPATLGNVSDAETIRIDITPLDAGLRLWSFVSVTNNSTHHVTTFSAQ